MLTPTWETLRDRWPNAGFSRFLSAGDVRWHVQIAGTGPTILLLHGSGGATHSWRDVLPRLAPRFTVVAPDLPGHGFTSRPPANGLTLTGMAASLAALIRTLDIAPRALVGHSAGGALALWLATQHPTASIVGLNAALTPPNALMTLLAPAAHVLAPTGFMGALTARLADSDFVFDALMKSTGSVISADQRALYRVFARSPERAGALMTMFAGWDLNALTRRLPLISNPVTLIVGANDGWVSARDTRRAAARMPHARVIELPGAGHLAHEEFPVQVADIIAGSVT